MPSRTLEDKVEDLTRLAAVLTEQASNFEKEINKILATQAATAPEMADLKTRAALLERQAGEWSHLKEQMGTLSDLEVAIALLERSVEDLKKTRDEWSRRFWAMAGPILGARVGVVLCYFLRR